MSGVAAEPVELKLEPRQARRLRWAGSLAEVICTLHLAAATIVFGWYYWTVPKWKHQLDDFGYELTTQAKYLIHISDYVVWYWYLLIPFVPIVLITDLVVTRWIAWHLGIRYASLVGLFVFVLMLASVAIGQYTLIDAKTQILKLISIQGPSPWARSSSQ